MPRATARTGLGRLCAARGLSLSGLARELGIHSSIPRLWANRRRALPADRRARVSEILGVSELELAVAVDGGPVRDPAAGLAVSARDERTVPLIDRYGLVTGCRGSRHVSPVLLGRCLELHCVDPECERFLCAACGATWGGRQVPPPGPTLWAGRLAPGPLLRRPRHTPDLAVPERPWLLQPLIKDSVERCVRCCWPEPRHHVLRRETPGDPDGPFLARPIASRYIWLCDACLPVYEGLGLLADANLAAPARAVA